MPRGGEGAKKESKKPHAKAMVRGEHKKRRSSRNQRHKAKEEGRQPNLGEEWFGAGSGRGGEGEGAGSAFQAYLVRS